MSTRDLELELARLRGEDAAGSGARRLSVDEAIAYRNAGNLPDEGGRSLRLVLRVDDLDRRRLDFEPDFHDPPAWRREGSKPVNVVPIGERSISPSEVWWDDPDVAELDAEWERHGTMSGLHVPGEYRSFVYKTVIALKKAGRPVTVDIVAGSLARWLDRDDYETIRSALMSANAKGAGPPQVRPPSEGSD